MDELIVRSIGQELLRRGYWLYTRATLVKKRDIKNITDTPEMTEAGRNHAMEDQKNVLTHNRLDIWIRPGLKVGSEVLKTRNLGMQPIPCAAAQSKGLLFRSQLFHVVGSSKRARC